MGQREDEYAWALDDLDRRKAAGEISDGKYQVWRQELLNGLGAKPDTGWPWWARLLIWIVVTIFLIIPAAVLLLRLLLSAL